MKASDQKRFDSQYQKHLLALKLNNYSDTTIDVYSRAVRRLVACTDCPPDRVTPDQCRAHFSALIDSHSWSTVISDRAGLSFFFTQVLDKQWDWNTIVKPKRVKSLPDVITYCQVAALLDATREMRYQSYFLAAYSMGLRLAEALELEVQDIHAEQNRVHIRLGKGNKDRYVILPNLTLLAMRRYWATHRNPRFIFPSGVNAQARFSAEKPMSKSGVQRAIKTIALDAGIHTPITTRTLRHAYATHLLERGLSLPHIQEQLGHAWIETTLVYTKLTDLAAQNANALINQMIDQLPSKLDARG